MPDAVKVPVPLDGEEIRKGIAERMAKEFEAAVYASLTKTCALNRQSYPKFSASWLIRYELDDFGRLVGGAIGGNVGEVSEKAESIEGKVDPMPPDAFRRETGQPVPAAQTVQKKPDDGTGMTKTPRGRRKGNGV